MRKLIGFAIILIGVCGQPISATLLHVPASYATIQSAIDNAIAGDSVLVAKGVYTGSGNRDLDCNGKQLVILSESGADSTIIDCQATNLDRHRGFHFHSGELATTVVAGFTIRNGYAPEHPDYPGWPMGGAIRCSGSSPTIQDCIFSSNTSGNGGAGIAAVNSSNPVINHNIFENNSALYGAGVYCYQGSNPSVTNSKFVRNSASVEGGGLSASYSCSPTISYCSFDGNNAVVGAGIQCYELSAPTITNCTFVNDSSSYATGVSSNNSSPTISQCILTLGVKGNAINCTRGGTVTISCNDIFGNAGGDYASCITGMQGVSGNISANPRFCNVVGGDYSISNTSPCAPANNSCGVLVGASGINCVEAGTARTWYVKADGSGDLPTIQLAIDSSHNADTVLVAAGTYTGTGNRDLDFHGRLILVRSESGAASTIINCEADSLHTHRGFHFHSGEDASAIVDGFTIINGYAPAHPDYPNWPMGGAIRCGNSSPVIRNCVFSNNRSDNGGAGVAAVNGSHPSISNCRFEANAALYGAGLYCYQAAHASVSDCLFKANSAKVEGGGVSASMTSSPTVSKCVFDGNSAVVGAGIQCYYYSEPTITSCTFVNNTANYGSGISSNLSGPTVSKSIIAYGKVGNGINCVNTGFAAMTCSDVFSNAGGDYVGCLSGMYGVDGNILSDPQFCDLGAGVYTISLNSPCAATYNSCGDLIGAYGVGCGSFVGGRVWHVQADGLGEVATIQAAIDSSRNADTVLVAAGTYMGTGNRDLDFHGKSIVVMSASGADLTIIDCQADAENKHRGFHLHSGEDSLSVIDGFTIKNGFAPYHPDYPDWPMGGGIRCGESSPQIRNCVLISNRAGNGGAGIAAVNGSNPLIENCVLAENESEYGAGLYWYNGSGGKASHCTIKNNTAFQDGAGLDASFSSSPRISFCTISGNSALVGGGMMCYDGSDAELQNCTFFGNSATHGSGINSLGSHPIVTSCIIVNGMIGKAFNCATGSDFGAISCTDIYGNAGGNWIDCLSGLNGLNGNFSIDPKFCDSNSGDFRLYANSPCIPANNSCNSLVGALGIGCGAVCGDIDGSGMITISDAVYLLSYIFAGGQPPMDIHAGDVNCSGSTNISDAVYLISYIFLSGSAPCAACP